MEFPIFDVTLFFFHENSYTYKINKMEKWNFSSCNRHEKTKFCFNLYIIRERTNQEVIFHRLLCCSPRVSNFYTQRNKGTANLENRAVEKSLSS